jgi:hypothetical protein
MKFVYPDFLFALLALAIPILIHLFNFKKFKRVEFSNVAFLQEIKQESKSKSKLKEWLILLSRLLAITFLVLAFAQPYIPVSEKQSISGDKAVSIYIDNSFSMNGTGNEGRLLDMAKQYVYKIIDSYPAGQKFQLITSDLSGNTHRSFSKESVEEQLAKLEDSPNSLLIDEVIAKQEKWLLEKNVKAMDSYVISDFQRSSITDLNVKLDTTINYRWLKLEQTNTSNLFIDSVWLETPAIRINEDLEIKYRLKNTGKADLNGVKLSLNINGTTYGSTSANVPANATEEGIFAIIPTETGYYKAEIELEDFPIEYDNSWFFSFTIEPNTNVIILNERDSSTLLGNVYSTSKQFISKQFNYSKFNFSNLKTADVVVLNSLEKVSQGLSYELKSFAENGGVVCIIPNVNATTDYKDLFQLLELGATSSIDTTNRRTNSIKYNDPFYSDVFEKQDDRIDLPIVFNYLKWKTTQLDNSTQLLGLENGDPLLYKKQLGKGSVFVWASNTDKKNSSLADHSIFLLSLYKIGLAKTSSKPLSYSIQPNLSLTSNYSGPTEFLKLKNEKQEFIPEIRNVKTSLQIWPHENAKTAGFYDLLKNDSILDVFALNYPRTESDLNFWDNEALASATENYSNLSLLEDNFENFEFRLNELTSGVKYWKWMIALALLMLMIEILLIKLWRN